MNLETRGDTADQEKDLDNRDNLRDLESGSTTPDGGWGWVVVLSSFLLQALAMGLTYTFGVMFVVLLDEFKESEAVTAWVGSLQPALVDASGMFFSLFLL